MEQVKASILERQKMIEETTFKVEQLHSSLNEAKSSLASANEKNRTLQAGNNDLVAKLSTLQKDKARLEKALEEKVHIKLYIAFTLGIQYILIIYIL